MAHFVMNFDAAKLIRATNSCNKFVQQIRATNLCNKFVQQIRQATYVCTKILPSTCSNISKLASKLSVPLTYTQLAYIKFWAQLNKHIFKICATAQATNFCLASQKNHNYRPLNGLTEVEHLSGQLYAIIPSTVQYSIYLCILYSTVGSEMVFVP